MHKRVRYIIVSGVGPVWPDGPFPVVGKIEVRYTVYMYLTDCRTFDRQPCLILYRFTTSPLYNV